MANLASLTAQLVEARQNLLEDLEGRRRHIKTGRATIEQARRGPVPLDELPERSAGVAAFLGDRWIERNRHALVNGPGALAGPGLALHQVGLPLNELATFGFLCAADPARAADLLMAVLSRCAYTSGPPSSERAALIQQLETELAEAEAAEERLVDEALELGIADVRHRPEVLERREAARRRQQQKDHWLQKQGGKFLDPDLHAQLEADEITPDDAVRLQGDRDTAKSGTRRV